MPSRRVQAVRVRIPVDRRPFDVLHHEVRQPVRCRPTVVETRNVRMLEGGEDLPLVLEPPDDDFRIHAAANHLDRDAALERLVGAPSQIDGAHAAVPDAGFDVVRTDRASDDRRRSLDPCEVRRRDGAEQPDRGSFEEIGGVAVGRQQRNDLVVDRGLAATGLRDERPSSLDGLRQGPFEDLPGSAPVFGTLHCHGAESRGTLAQIDVSFSTRCPRIRTIRP